MGFDDLLKEVLLAWPQSRIEKSKERLLKIWDKKIPADRIPFVFERIPDENGVNLDILESFGYSVDVSLYFQLCQLKKRALFDDDYIPSLYAGYRQNMIPSGFGGQEIIKANATQYWPKPVLKKPEEVYDLPEFSLIDKNSTIFILLENMKFFRKETLGTLPLHIVDPQDAMANASTLLDINDYFAALYSNPDEIHFLHKLCNEAIKKFIDCQIEISEDDYVPINTFWFAWMPKAKGISLSIDVLAMVSPDTVEKFVLPYLNEISDYYGGVVVHSCGNWVHNLEMIKKTSNLVGIDFGVTETDVGSAIKVFGREVTYMLHNSYVAVNPLIVQSQEKYIEAIADAIKENNIAAQVQLFMPPGYSLSDALELNEIALKHFTF